MKKRIVIEYDLIENEVKVAENDFGTFELFGVLEAVKAMNAHHWYSDDERRFGQEENV